VTNRKVRNVFVMIHEARRRPWNTGFMLLDVNFGIFLQSLGHEGTISCLSAYPREC
jgi:hypothetical protein